MQQPRFNLPNLGIGVGLRAVHYQHILSQQPDIAWFEALSDNYMNTAGRPLLFLDRIAEHYPIALHGVGLSIGSPDPLDWDYLAQLKALRNRVQAHWVSDHIAWTGLHGKHGHDLYPMPMTEESVRHIARRVKQVQDFLEAPLALENPSTYLRLGNRQELDEGSFIRAIAEEADCALLLDVNNLFVNAHNHGFDATQCLRSLPLQRVVQFHVAGHSLVRGMLIDTHIGPVPAPVWSLLAEAFRLGADASILLEWDAEIPDFETVHQAALVANSLSVDTQRTLRPPGPWQSESIWP